MDSELREKERIYRELPTTENYLSLLRAILRAGKILEVNHPSMAINWGPELIEFLSDKIPQLKIFDYEIIPWNPETTRSFLIGQVRCAITDDIYRMLQLAIAEEPGEELADPDWEAEIADWDMVTAQVTSAAGGDYRIVGVSFSFNKTTDGFDFPGYFYVVTHNSAGFAEHSITMIGSDVEYDLTFQCNTYYVWGWEGNEDREQHRMIASKHFYDAVEDSSGLDLGLAGV